MIACMQILNLFKFWDVTLPFEKGRTRVLSATPWINDSTTVQNIVIIAIVPKL
jgi:hypothetical protein